MADQNEINIKVTANSDDAASGLSKATGEVQKFSDQVNNLAQRVAAVKPDAFKELAEQFNTGKLDLDEFRDGLISVSAAEGTAAKAAEGLAEKSHLSSGAMRELVVVGRELASGNINRLPGSLSLLATRLGGIPPAAILATGAIAGLAYALYESIDSSEQFEADLIKLQNAFTAVGAGDQFDRSQAIEYIRTVKQIPGVTADAATSIVNEFARARNGTQVLPQAIRDIKPLADLLGVEVPQAAKILAESLNDPKKGLQELQKYGVELTAEQQQQITQMLAVNDVAGAQKVLFDGIATALKGVQDTSTGLEKFWNNLANGISRVNTQAEKGNQALDAYITKFRQTQDMAAGKPPQTTEPASARPDIPDYDAQDRAAQRRKDNETIAASNQMFERGNSLLREQEQHRQNISNIQQAINAAEREGDQEAVKRANANLETENKRYYGEPAKPDRSEDRYDLAQAKGDGEVAQARIKTEQDVVEEKLRLGEIATADAITQLRQLASQEHQINLQRIADMRSVYARQGDKAGVAKSDSDTEVENERYSQQQNKFDSRELEAQQKSRQEDLEDTRRIADAKSQVEVEGAESKARLGEQSAEQELTTKLAALEQQHAADDAYFNGLAALYGKDSEAYKKALADKQIADLKWTEQVNKLNTDAALRAQQDWQKSIQPITKAFDTSIQGMVLGTQTLHQATMRIGQSIVSEFVGNVIHKMVDNWLLGEAQKTAASEIGARARQIADSEGTNQAVQDNIENTGKQQQTDAVGVFSNVFNYLSPDIGPFAAVPAAAASAAILALSLPSAAGGMIVPNDTLAMVHENEMVLPARYTSGLTSMIDQANSGGGAGAGHTFNNTFHVSANDGVSAKQLPDMIVKTMSKAVRNGQFGAMRSG